jgi:hypothetical protein
MQNLSYDQLIIDYATYCRAYLVDKAQSANTSLHKLFEYIASTDTRAQQLMLEAGLQVKSDRIIAEDNVWNNDRKIIVVAHRHFIIDLFENAKLKLTYRRNDQAIIAGEFSITDKEPYEHRLAIDKFTHIWTKYIVCLPDSVHHFHLRMNIKDLFPKYKLILPF